MLDGLSAFARLPPLSKTLANEIEADGNMAKTSWKTSKTVINMREFIGERGESEGRLGYFLPASPTYCLPRSIDTKIEGSSTPWKNEGIHWRNDLTLLTRIQSEAHRETGKDASPGLASRSPQYCYCQLPAAACCTCPPTIE